MNKYRQADDLIMQYRKGNDNDKPSSGIRHFGKDMWYIRGQGHDRSVLRVFYRIRGTTMEILSKCQKKHEVQTMAILRKIYKIPHKK